MKTIVPDYYSRFRCIAGECRHSCCIGWEIDIDEDSCARYRSVGGEFGRRLAESIQWGAEPYFKLGEGERCPFLNGGNLCDIIINMGEEGLCQICADHPRFRNFFDSRTEMGLGLCCEAAAGLVVNNPEPVALTVLEDDGNEAPESMAGFFDMRENIFRALQDRRVPMAVRLERVMSGFGIVSTGRSLNDWARVYSSLEQLDEAWGGLLAALADADDLSPTLPDVVQEQLMVYFIYRHLADGMSDGTLRQRIAFAILSTRMIGALCCVSGLTAAEVARMYSAEIEYSDENIDRLLSVLSECVVDWIDGEL